MAEPGRRLVYEFVMKGNHEIAEKRSNCRADRAPRLIFGAEHEMIHEELRAAAEQVRQLCRPPLRNPPRPCMLASMRIRTLASSAMLFAWWSFLPPKATAQSGKCIELHCFCPGTSGVTKGSCSSTCEQICGISNNNGPSYPSNPPGSVSCGNAWCPAGTKCGSNNTCPKSDDVDCGGGKSCSAGSWCGPSGGCIPNGSIACGASYCSAGDTCGSGNRCLQLGAQDCGGGRSCRAGFFCGSHGRCVIDGGTACGSGYCRAGTYCNPRNTCTKVGNIECGDHSCGPDSFCGSRDRCMKNLSTDCGNGTACGPGSKCAAQGGCFQITSQECSGGGACPTGTKCSVTQHGCIRTAYRVPSDQTEINSDYEIEKKLEKLAKYLPDVKFIAGYQADLNAAMSILGMGWMCTVQIRGLEQRKIVLERTRSHLLRLQKKVLDLAITRMTDDTKNLVPFKVDTAEKAAERREAALAMSRELKALWAQASKELDISGGAFQEVENPDSRPKNILTRQFGDGEKAYLKYTPGPALIRLEEIKRTGQYWD